MPGAGEGKVEGGNLLSRWTRVLADDSSVRLQLYYDRAFLQLPVAAGDFGGAGTFEDDLQTYDLDFQHDLSRGGTHNIIWGFGYRHIDDRTKAAPALGFDPPAVQQDNFSAFVQDQIAIADRTLLTIGTKLEHTEYTGFEVGPSIRLQHDLNSNMMVWSAISRAVRTPSRVDRDIRQPSSGQAILAGGRTFDSETVVAYEAGMRGRFGSRLVGAVSVYYNDYGNVRSLTATPTTILPLVIANDLEGASHGVELTFNADISRNVRLHGGYTYLQTDLQVRSGRMDLNNGLNETADPEHQFSIGSSIDLPRGVEFDTHLRWVDTLVVNNGGQPGMVPSYMDLNVRIGMQVSRNVELSIVGHNLLDDHHAEIGAPGANRVEIRRSVFAKVALRY